MDSQDLPTDTTARTYHDLAPLCGREGLAFETVPDDEGGRLIVALLAHPVRSRCAFSIRTPRAITDLAWASKLDFPSDDETDDDAASMARFLPGPDAVRDARTAINAATIPEDMRHALHAVLDRGPPPRSHRLHNYRLMTGEGLWDILEMSLTHPALIEIAWQTYGFVMAVRERLPVGECLRRAWPGITPAHVSRFATGPGASLPKPTRRVPDLHDRRWWEPLLALPAEWMPRDEAWQAFQVAAEGAALASVNGRLGAATLLAPSKGDWPGFLARLMAAAGATEPDTAEDMMLMACEDVASAAEHMADTLIQPLLVGDPAWGTVDISLFFADAEAVAASILYGGKGLPAVLETSRTWHAMRARITSAISTTTGTEEWPPVIGEPFVNEGVSVVPICDAFSLGEEGNAGPDRNGCGGLDHCVATHWPDFRSGEAHILSIRRALPDGGYVRLATARIRIDPYGYLEREQVRGLRNAVPPDEAIAALSALEEAVRGGMVALNPEALERRPHPGSLPPEEAVRILCGYDHRDEEALKAAVLAWSPLLPRDLRGGLGPLREAVARYSEPPTPVRGPLFDGRGRPE